MKLSLGFSSCPNDTFMLDAIVHEKIDTSPFNFEYIIEDIETLNKRALNNELDVSKLSFYTYLKIRDSYKLLDSGCALGHNCGPLLIGNTTLDEDQIISGPIAIPGQFTTANLLFSLRYPEATNKSVLIFSEIEDAILCDKVKGGVIIHENRFTYAEKGLEATIDLGEFWESTYRSPIPLGGFFANSRLEDGVSSRFSDILKESINFAFNNPGSSRDFVKYHAQEMDDHVIDQHIRLYVNKYSLDLGETGLMAIRHLQAAAQKNNLI
jgi:1,4-dihydroxy-6-naphthoate synthase